jgi:hypothetical protein
MPLTAPSIRARLRSIGSPESISIFIIALAFSGLIEYLLMRWESLLAFALFAIVSVAIFLELFLPKSPRGRAFIFGSGIGTLASFYAGL